MLFPLHFPHNDLSAFFLNLLSIYSSIRLSECLYSSPFFSNLLPFIQFSSSSPCSNTWSWSQHQNMWHFLLLYLIRFCYCSMERFFGIWELMVSISWVIVVSLWDSSLFMDFHAINHGEINKVSDGCFQ